MHKLKIASKNFEDIKSKLARSLKETLYNECSPPPNELHIPYGSVVEDKEEPYTALAVVTYIVRCPGEKKHTVHIKFKYDKEGKFLRDTMEYV
jgi:hypothetical protein